MSALGPLGNSAFGACLPRFASSSESVAVAPCRPAQAPPPPADPLWSNWGFGVRENQFNGGIAKAAETWSELPPRLFKALVAAESAFDPTAVSRTGASGLVQLTTESATRHGLSLSPVDERLVPAKALPVGVAVLREKHEVIANPDVKTPHGAKVAEAYAKLGRPAGDDLWRLDLAAYNGGGGTVLRAMANAYDRGLDPRSWDDLVGTEPRKSPLYAATREIYGERGALAKYHEMAQYPGRILGFRDRA